MDIDYTQLERTTVATDDPAKYSWVFSTGKRRHYHQQFDKLYFLRLRQLKPLVLEQAKTKWPTALYTSKVLNVEKSTQPTYIIGTLFIDSNDKPSTLHEVDRSRWISDPTVEKPYRDEPAVFLEDESGRIALVNSQLLQETLLVSGLVAGLLGKETADGEFEVADICYAGMAPHPHPHPHPPLTQPSQKDKYVALVSGLDATIDQPVTLEMQLLAEFLTGNLGSSSVQRQCSQIAQVLIAGGLVQTPAPPLGHTEDAKANDRRQAASLMSQMDAYLADIAACVPLSVMPGAADPADLSMPQQPMHPSMFGQCRRSSGFRSLSNPAILDLDQRQVLATAGQNIDDLRHYITQDETPAQIAGQSLQWRHIAPSAPDTLWCYPFIDHDPFVLDSSPHLYVVGNQPAFETGVAGGGPQGQTRIVAVPRFSATHTIALLNLRTMEATPIKFIN